jgi:hypothetical protein
MLTLPTIVVYTHITNDKNHFNGASFPNQNMIHLQTSKNSSPKHKMENNTKPCAKKLA